MMPEVMLWKFARERAFAAGTAAINIEIFLRRMFEYFVFKTREQILKRKFSRDGMALGLTR
jgi:hypothetical protein